MPPAANGLPPTIESSGAFVETCDIGPTGNGPLAGLRFAVKDLIDLADRVTGCGNPRWRETHDPAVVHAVCVEQLLAAGAACVGKTVTDELAFSLIGENEHFGTPLNPLAPDRVPGGSSSGSASAVACGLVDVALGTDTGGSVRVPAGNCGVFGFRPSHGRVSLAGVNTLAPSFDTVGLFARDVAVLARAAGALLGRAADDAEVGTLYRVDDAFVGADPEVRDALAAPLERLEKALDRRCQPLTLAAVPGLPLTALPHWFEVYGVISWAEAWTCLGAWVRRTNPVFGADIGHSFAMLPEFDRRQVAPGILLREQAFQALRTFLGPTDVVCLPTTPTLAPKKGSIVRRDAGSNSYYPRTLAFTAVGGIGRLPQVSLPLGWSDGVPVGLSLAAAHGRDEFLLGVAERAAG